jgi:hypothetical protein
VTRSIAAPALRYLALVALALACRVAAAQPSGLDTAPAEPVPVEPVPATTDPAKSWTIPIAEVVAFDLLLSRYNHYHSGSTDYDVSTASIRRNLRGPWVVDNDPFSVNQFAHPYQGSLYHTAGRSTGLNFWESAALTFAGSAWWEITGEQTPPSRNDQVASGIAGTFLGEALFRMAQLTLRDGSSVPQAYREWVAAIISPSVGLNRLAFGPRFDSVYADHDPAYYGRVHLGYTHVVQHPFDAPARLDHDMAQADFAIDYGLPGKPGYTYRRPFDYFRLQVLFSSANGIENLSTRGLLYGTDYAVGDDYRGIWGLYGHYDYIAPQLFQVSTTALSLGTTGQWWASKSIALQGSALVGLGYAATSTTGATAVIDGNYHYGASTPAALMMRAVAGDRAAIDISGRFISLGHMTRRTDGRDEISRIDSAFTWRVHGQHAIGVNYLWSHRSASYPVIGTHHQTLGTVGVYYTMLSRQGFGVVDWRPTAAL